MTRRKRCVAMLLAGGQGSRLGVLTRNMAKPAVPFGGKYRIIDFALSNCVNSEIDTVGVLTQYKPLVLNAYIGSGQPWDLDRNDGGVYVLPPYQQEEKGEWYNGTANAIYQNLKFLDQYSPTYVLVLSGDHIYKMDYARMIQYHAACGADATIAVIDVPWEEAKRFGILNTDESGRILEFEEKPKKPKNNQASMGVYVFTYAALKEYLIKDERNEDSSHDFGKDVIPLMLNTGKKLFAYRHQGYWRDVGTVASLWEANMDLISDPPRLDLNDARWRIYSRNPVMPPHYIAPGATVVGSMVTEGCRVYGSVSDSILFAGVTVEQGARISDSIVMPGTVIGRNTQIRRAIIGGGTVIGEDCFIGDVLVGGPPGDPQAANDDGITVVACRITVKPNTSVFRGDVLKR